jgi:hypothetical protein
LLGVREMGGGGRSELVCGSASGQKPLSTFDDTACLLAVVRSSHTPSCTGSARCCRAHTLTSASCSLHISCGVSLLFFGLQVSNVSSSCRAALAASSQTLADKTAGLQTELDVTLRHFDSIMEGTTELQVEVTDEVRDSWV